MILLYALSKYIAYTIWCYIGLRYLISPAKHTARCAFFLGFIRLLIGIFFGIAIGFMAGESFYNVNMFTSVHWASYEKIVEFSGISSIFTYLAVYVPIRIVEWLLLLPSIKPQCPRKKTVLWVGGGIIISILVDVFFAPSGLRVGRIFC